MSFPKTCSNRMRETTIPFSTEDGLVCNLIHVEADRSSERGPVLLVHGAGVRANIFRPPVKQTLVDFLLDAGYDVWLENWRASIDLPPNPWTLDQAAVYDHPKAVELVVEQTGAQSIKAITQCQGSTSFVMSAIAGLLPQVDVIVSNAVSLHPIIPLLSSFKLNFGVPLFRFFSDYMNPQWGIAAPTWPAKLISLIVSLTHHECDNAVCKQVSFTYGAGFPSLWSHENLSPATHDWIRHEFAECSMNFFRQIARCARAGHLVPVDHFGDLPRDFVSASPQTTARFAFFAGEKNMCFYPDSQRRTFAYFDRLRPNYHSLHVLPNYGHLDVFIGEGAATDVFPLIAAELERTA